MSPLIAKVENPALPAKELEIEFGPRGNDRLEVATRLDMANDVVAAIQHIVAHGHQVTLHYFRPDHMTVFYDNAGSEMRLSLSDGSKVFEAQPGGPVKDYFVSQWSGSALSLTEMMVKEPKFWSHNRFPEIEAENRPIQSRENSKDRPPIIIPDGTGWEI